MATPTSSPKPSSGFPQPELAACTRSPSCGRIRTHSSPSACPTPYAVIELDEGVRMVSNVVGVDPDDVKCELPVRVDFERVDDEITVPIFRPVD